MAQFPSSLPPAFAELERRLAYLVKLHSTGRINQTEFQSEAQKLTLRDSSGATWWLGGAPGAWHRWNGLAWVPAQPPMIASRKLRNRATPGGMPRWGLLFGIALIACTCLLVGGVFVYGSYADYNALPKIVEGETRVASASPFQALTTGQQRLRTDLGPPEAFYLLFYAEPQPDGSAIDVRCETWSYFSRGEEYTFINGELVEQRAVEAEFTQLAPAPYLPEQFGAYMSLDEVRAAAGIHSYVVAPLEEILVPGGDVYFAPQLTFGLRAGELLYIEALALDVEALP